jgi:23S rRNA pseudouridine1911/1915/1917 synthase
MNPQQLNVIYEDNHLLAVLKPAGLATMGLAANKTTLLALAKQYVKEHYRKPGNVYLGTMSRLDAPVTGIVLFARTSKAARRLTEQFRSRSVQKTYWGLLEGVVRPATGEWVNWLAQDERHRRVRVVGPTQPGAKEARLAYRRLEVLDGNSWLDVELQTGRKHQIRVQAADRCHPILGDRKYGSQQTFPAGIGLHCRRLVINHPVRGHPITLEAPVPGAWHAFGVVG